MECAWHVLALLAAIVGAALGRVALALQRRLFGALVGSGRLPRHIAFIMDGNRRFALARSLSNKFDGHLHGFRRLEKVSLCARLAGHGRLVAHGGGGARSWSGVATCTSEQ